MIRKKVDRRVAMVTLGGILATASVATFGWPWSPEPQKTQISQNVYVAPTWWDGRDANMRSLFLTWDYAFWQVESQQPMPTLPQPANSPFNAMAGIIHGMMSVSGQDSIKALLASFLATSQRSAYVPYMAAGLSASCSGTHARQSLAGALGELAATTGPSMFSPPVRQSLLLAWRLETDLTSRNLLEQVLTDLSIPH